MGVHTGGGEKIEVLEQWTGTANNETPPGAIANKGLYDRAQFQAFSNLLQNKTNLSAAELQDAIILARAPTKYDAANYLIPFFEENEETTLLDTVAPGNREMGQNVQNGAVLNNLRFVQYGMYAPLVGEKMLYTENDLGLMISKIQVLMKNTEGAIENYLTALASVATDMRTKVTSGDESGNDGASYASAANGLHPNAAPGAPSSGTYTMDATSADTCAQASMASRMAAFFNSDQIQEAAICGIVPIHHTIMAYIRASLSENPQFAERHFTTFAFPVDPSLTVQKMSTAYHPGPRQGADINGDTNHPFLNNVESKGGRSAYSVKHIQIAQVLNNTAPESLYKFPSYEEIVQGGNVSINSMDKEVGMENGVPNFNALLPNVMSEFNDFLDY
jgi:hypothetical protein